MLTVLPLAFKNQSPNVPEECTPMCSRIGTRHAKHGDDRLVAISVDAHLIAVLVFSLGLRSGRWAASGNRIRGMQHF